jgi:hypothetical protein
MRSPVVDFVDLARLPCIHACSSYPILYVRRLASLQLELQKFLGK